jgi:hypothetical protein
VRTERGALEAKVVSTETKRGCVEGKIGSLDIERAPWRPQSGSREGGSGFLDVESRFVDRKRRSPSNKKPLSVRREATCGCRERLRRNWETLHASQERFFVSMDPLHRPRETTDGKKNRLPVTQRASLSETRADRWLQRASLGTKSDEICEARDEKWFHEGAPGVHAAALRSDRASLRDCRSKPNMPRASPRARRATSCSTRFDPCVLGSSRWFFGAARRESPAASWTQKGAPPTDCSLTDHQTE